MPQRESPLTPTAARRRLPLLATHFLLAAALLLALAQALRAEVRRCEDASGHVTYSNESCPSGTAHERPVEERSAVSVPHEPGEKASHSGKLTISPPAPAATPAGEDVQREQRKSQTARCDDLVHRIEYAQQDLMTAGSGERASMELGLRRLQEEHEANCAPKQQ